MTEIVSTMKETTADIITCCKTNTDTSRYDVGSTLYTACKSLSTPQLTYSTTPVKSESVFKPGGTMILSSGPITARIIDKGTDYLGRWSYHTYGGKKGIKCTVISCYQIPDNKAKKGRFTNFSQQQAYLLQQNRTVNNIRKLFYSELSNFVQSLQDKEHDILLIGDFNDDMKDINSGMAKLLARHKLHDLMRYAVGTGNVTTYTRGCRRLDYALGSERFLLSFIQGGYERFGDRVKTDHRPFFLDFDTKKLFGTLHIHPSLDQERYLSSRDKPKLTQYIKILHDKLEQQNVFERMNQLFLSDAPDHALVESLDELYVRLALKVEFDERRRHQHEWSEKLLKQRSHVSYLKYHLAQFLTHVSHRESMEYLNTKYGPFEAPPTLLECQQQLRTQQQALQKLIKESVTTRLQELEEKIKSLELAAEEASKEKIKSLRQIIRAEQLKHLYQKIQRLKRTKQGILHKLEVPINSEDNPKKIEGIPEKWKVLDTNEMMTEALMERNVRHFGQTEIEETPVFQSPLKEDINYTATTASADHILQGTYDTAQLDEITADFIRSMKKDHHLNTAEQLTITEVHDRIKIWTEATTTSPSGMHLGHYKALVNPHIHSNKDEEDSDKIEYDNYQWKLLNFRTQLLNYCIKWRYSLHRWHTVINRMLMKDPNNYKIHRLRVIHLYEADYSLLLAVHWRNTLHQAEDHRLLNKGTFGSRPNKSALTPVFLEELMLEITRLARKNLIMFDNDAKSCYDRIIASIMSIISRSFGASKSVVIVWAKTLQEAKFYLKTGKNVTEDFFTHCEAHPIHGSGQGATNSPCGWLFISSKLFDVYDEHASGASFISPDRSRTITIFMIGFVDDTKSQVNKFLQDPQPTIDELATTMQQDAQLWNDLLWQSGGSLELSKCSFHTVSWFFDKGFPVMEGGKPTSQLVVKGPHGPQQIKGLSAYSAHKTLGHYKSPSGSQYKQFQVLQAKCDEHAAFLQGNYLTPRETYTYYSGFYLPSVTYTLPNTYFSRKELHQIEKKAFNSIITKIGMCNKTHRSVICGPIGLGGRSLRYMYMEQGILQIKQLITDARRNDFVGSALFIALQWAQYTAGLGVPLLEMEECCSYSEAKWISSVQRCLVENDMKLHFYSSYVPPLQREHDEYIMQRVIDSRRYSIRQQHQINHVRMYLQVVTIADISNAAGTCINLHLTFKGSSCTRDTSYVPIHQESPPDASWNLWYEVIALFCTTDGTLYQQLGNWVVPPADIRMQWDLFFSEEAKCIIHRPTLQALYPSPSYSSGQALPPDSVPVDSVTHLPHTKMIQPPIQMFPVTFQEHLHGLEPWERDLLQDIRLTPSTTNNLIVDLLVEGDIVIASDGSVAAERGTFGWVIAQKSTGFRLVESSGWARGALPSSYRAEIYGGLSLHRYLFHLCSYYNITMDPQIHWYCDNESLVGTSVDDTVTLPLEGPLEDQDQEEITGAAQVLQSDWDVLTPLRSTIKALKTSPNWVESHQDKEKDIDTLPLDAQLNCRSDQLATAQQKKQPPPDLLTVPPIPDVPVQLSIAGATITSKHVSSIRRKITEAPLMEYIAKKNKWDPATVHLVDWKLHESLTRKHQSCSYSKYLHGCLPVNATLFQRNQSSTPTCTRCGLHPETDIHVLQCTQSQQWLEALFSWYTITGTQHKLDPVLLDILIEGIRSGLKDRQLRSSRFPVKYRQAITDMNSIGWCNWFKNRVSFSMKALFPKPDKKQSVLLLFLNHTTLQWKELWNERNQLHHGKTKDEILNAKTQRAHAELAYIYSRRHLYLPVDRDLLLPSLQEHKQLPLSSIQNWILLYKQHFQKSAKLARKKALKGVKRITHYFQVKKR